jgi:type IV pilus assembly protein PilM
MRAGIRSRPWAGLDVGSFSVKLLAWQGSGARPLLAEVPLPPNGAERSPETIARAVAEALSRAGLPPRGVRGITMGISGADVIIKQVSMPLLADDEVGPALRYEARKHLPFDPQGMVIDYQILGRYLSEKRLDVLLAAVSQDHLESQIAPLRMLDLEVDVVDAAPLALTNALVHHLGGTPGTCALLDLGHTSSHLTLWQRGEPYFARRLDFGGLTLTRAIAAENRVPLEEAEEWKLDAGSGHAGFRVDWEVREMQAMLRSLQTDLLEELRRSFAFYSTLGHLPDPMRLFLSGGSARLPGLAAKLSDVIGSPVELFDPLAEQGALEPVAPQFAQAFGLALRAA